MPEWFKGPVLKTGVRQRTVGSNPSPSGSVNMGHLHKIPFLAVYCSHVPCFQEHVWDLGTWTIPHRCP